ncbi:lysophospholipid acyltransferase family protein [Chamaesiphon sp. OTE_8_metabat_110]|uniref:lysophospholipid acyltransferase family protein n=1 Tax=Chamaesiphon sp. OTE_8_metabat_110 TaxID=2964696 RepID=UPI00286AE6DC|nr:lysophospholipid acyltransferase family protein [Chamaesiphon sp. OTE_8_metabat_110]
MNLLESIAPFDGYATAIAQDIFGLLGIGVKVQNPERLPSSGPLLIVCNHRSFLDPFILTSYLNTPINFACHRYMGNVPVLREVLQSCGGFPLTNKDWYRDLVEHSTNYSIEVKRSGFSQRVPPRCWQRRPPKGSVHFIAASPI